MSIKQKKFLTSSAWNFGGMATAFILDTILKNLGVFNMPEYAVVTLGILIPRLTKVINIYFQEKAADNEM
jgi:hypothetical protein